MGFWSRLRGRARVTTAGEAAQRPRSRFAWLGGRRYMVDDTYILPRDIGEANRIDFQHFLLRSALHGNYAAPLQSPQSILDVACGNGRWAMEMAEIFTQANVVGVDLVAPPTELTEAAQARKRPENYVFVQGNVLDGLPFADASFDFTHQRLLYGSLPADRWQSVVQDEARVTRPLGWVELVESELMQADGPGATTFNRWLIDATARRGTDIRKGRTVGDMLRAAGLIHVTQRQVNIPIGKAHGHIGRMMESNTLAFVSGFKGMVVGQGIATDEQYDAVADAIRDEIGRRAYSVPYFIAYGQRPR